MSAHRRMRAYMDKHKVGALFEDLMSKLVSEMPSEPVPFLIRVLQQKLCQVVPQTVMNVPRLRRSLGDLALALDVEKVPVHKKPSSALVRRSRPTTPSVQVPHPPPRKSVILHCPKEKRSEMEKTVEFKTSNLWPEACNLAEVLPESQPDSMKSCQKEKIIAHAEYSKVSDEHSFILPKPQHVTKKWYQPGGYTGPILPGQVFNEDPLEDELIIFSKEKYGDAEKANNYINSSEIKRPNGLLTNSKSKFGDVPGNIALPPLANNGFTNNKVMDFLGTVEMFEDPIDLLNEGISISHGTGYKVNKKDFYNDYYHNVGCESLHFSMCTVCTKISKYKESIDDALQETRDNFKTFQISAKVSSLPSGGSSTMNSGFAKSANGAIADAFRTNTKSPTLSVLETDRTVSTEDLFATPRSLPLPLTPVDKVTLEWCTPSLESIHASANGWDIITSQDSDFF